MARSQNFNPNAAPLVENSGQNNPEMAASCIASAGLGKRDEREVCSASSLISKRHLNSLRQKCAGALSDGQLTWSYVGVFSAWWAWHQSWDVPLYTADHGALHMQRMWRACNKVVIGFKRENLKPWDINLTTKLTCQPAHTPTHQFKPTSTAINCKWADAESGCSGMPSRH